MRYDLAVIGAGPAGLAAAVRAADGGLRVALIDAAPAAGGQFYRQPAPELRAREIRALHHGWRAYASWSTRLGRHVAAGRVHHLAEHQVWTVARPTPDQDAAGEGSFAVHAVTGERGDGAATVLARGVVLATGAYERQYPFPGWTLPGVLTAGGAQAQLKTALTLPGRRIVVAGTGPLLLSVAAGLASAGAEVAAVVEAADPLRYARHWRALAVNPGKLAEGASYAARLLRHRVPVYTGQVVVAAHGTDRVEAVTVRRLRRDGTPAPGGDRTLACDTLAVGHGLDPQLDLGLALGCPVRADTDGTWVLTADAEQRTGTPGVWAAGESTGVGGAQLALAEGESAGHSAAHRLGEDTSRASSPAWGDGARSRPAARVARLRAFAAALLDVHREPAGWIARLADDTVICRCEEVPYAAVRAAGEDLGAGDPRSLKLLTRVGMGWCQGRMCGPAVQGLAAHLADGQAPPPPTRPLACPVPLRLLAEGADGAR
ncbi:NAD(P)/FAD-dependent oxidoreductase [Embleya sp. NBC_00896]|uniref:NAD(P)/FAD-dependent oxidoreductase n=1 Tax=Embleya sp. NBC_00896 TaxID=2975961 RepID=UPI002F90F026|nr:NAD(P)/FAD-dependent oxidoreductase [Embleya sp. NBC_00896]